MPNTAKAKFKREEESITPAFAHAWGEDDFLYQPKRKKEKEGRQNSGKTSRILERLIIYGRG